METYLMIRDLASRVFDLAVERARTRSYPGQDDEYARDVAISRYKRDELGVWGCATWLAFDADRRERRP